MGRLLLLASIPLFAGAAVLAQDRVPPDPAAAVPRDRLPVLGTVGDLPPEKERVIVALTAAGNIVVDGNSMDLNGLRQLLRERADRVREEEEARLSRLHVVLRADRAARWQDLQWAMQTCADPSVRVYRVLFAAVPEDGGAEGAMALFLPVDRGIPPGNAPPSPAARFPVKVRSAEPGGASASPPGPSLYAHLAKTFPDLKGGDTAATVDADPGVAGGAVLEAVDVLFRFGVKSVLVRGTTLNKSGKLSGTAAPAPAPAPAAVGVTLFGNAIGAPLPGDPLPPPAARVAGRMAGQAAPPEGGAVIVETPPIDEGEEVLEDGSPETAPGTFGLRRSAAAALKAGGGEGTETAVDLGLDWLVRHQSEGGYWDADGFEKRCGSDRCGGTGGPLYDPGVTGLALLCFLGKGETHKTPKHGSVVRNGLKYLKAMQDEEGCFGPRTSVHFVYNHAIATMAMAEAYGLTRSPLYKASAQNGANFIEHCRNPYLAWRYGVKPQDNDSSITTWMATALFTAREAGLDVDPASFDGAMGWLRKVTDPVHGRVGYTIRGNGPARPQELMDDFPAERSESLTAMGTWTRFACGQTTADPFVRKGLDLCLALPPKWSTSAGTIDGCYWLFGSLALHEAGGKDWSRWNDAMKQAVIQGQRLEPGSHRRGSWDPVDPWAPEGGRIYTTAMMVLTLETYYRYARKGE